jgi:catechol 2,3-dioxygenase-like lactoylglutathione lyase family enzyme
MTIRRVVPNVVSRELEKTRDFYVKLIGLELAIDMGWLTTYVSPSNPTAQINIVRAGPEPAYKQSITVEVEDVDRVHAEAIASGYQIRYPLTNEPWGVRRFAVEDPNGVVINVMKHLTNPEAK